MRRWILRAACALVLGGIAPAGLSAQTNVAHHGDPYRAATPYNATTMTRVAPNPANNLHNFSLGCDIPNLNPAGYVPPPCDCPLFGGCGSIFGGCGPSCGCDTGCGGSLLGGRFAIGDGCGLRRWSRFAVGGGCCDTGCNSGCAPAPAPASPPAPAPAAMPKAETKPASYIEPVGFWDFKDRKAAREEQQPNNYNCLNCPQDVRRKHTIPSPSLLGCQSCSTFESEGVFLFGSCRQFFGEPTHNWMLGRTR